jgi:putative ABC transport system permease protein
MWRIAFRSLFHDRTRLAASLAGVAFASILVFTQLGLFGGFLYTCSALIEKLGGDVWVMARGTEMADAGEALAAGSRAVAEAQPCVARVRPLVFGWGTARKPRGTLESIRVVGTAIGDGPLMPWDAVAGLPQDLAAPMRVSVDAVDLGKLQLPRNPLGARMELGGHTVEVAVVSRGIRSFTTLPMVFANLDTARRILGIPSGAVNFWILDLRDPACTDAVIRAVEVMPGLQARRRADFMSETETYWVVGSGAGAILTFVAFLGLVIGAVIVGQTLYSLTRDHHRELATLKAVGATQLELVGFVAWQAALLAVVGIAVGYGAAYGMRALAHDAGVTIVLAPWVVGAATGSLVLMCVGASLLGVRRVLKLEPAEVFS